MKFRFAALAAGTIALAACGGGSDDASTEAQADTVEITADEALAPVNEQPVADPNANVVTAPATPVEDTAEEDAIQQAGDDAAATAEAAMDAMGEDAFEDN